MAESRNRVTGNGGTDPAQQTPGEQAVTAADTSSAGATSATAAGEDGTPRRLRVAGMQDRFGPITVDGTEYMITRAGTDVAGPHVKAVRDAAKAHGVQLRSTKVPDAAR